MTANQIAYATLKENRRHNRAVESETQRSNVAREGETQRSNLATEAETERSNLAKEHQNLLNHVETRRSNIAKEVETNRSNLAREKETNRSNFAKESETALHNRITESHQSSELFMKKQDLESQKDLRDSQISESKSRTFRNYVDAGTSVVDTIANWNSKVIQPLMQPAGKVANILGGM